VNTSKARTKWPALITGVLLLACFGLALVLRVVLPYSHVFTSNGVIFTGNDAYYDMRLIANMVANFPHFLRIDPYLQYPGGPELVTPSLWQLLIGTVAKIVGLGSPSPHTVDVVGAYMPAVFGALTIVPVFFIAKTLWGKHGNWAGLVAGALVAVLPGEFMGRSILGFTEYHIAETLFSTTAILFLIMAIKSARDKIFFADLRHPKWEKVRKPLFYSILSGLFLGLYIWTWQGALLVVFTIAAYFVVQFVIDHMKERSTDYLSIVGTIIFLITLIFIPVAGGSSFTPLYAPSLVIAALLPAVLGILSRALAVRRWNRGFYPLVLVLLGLAGIGVLYLVKPSLVRSMLDAFSVFKPSGTLQMTVQAQSIFQPLSQGGGFFSTPAWLNFYLSLPLALLAMVILAVYSVLRRGNAETCAFVVWSIVMFVATIGQRRFAYYSTVNVALLAGYCAILIYYAVSLALARTAGDRTVSLTAKALDLDGPSMKTQTPSASPAVTTKKARRRARYEARRREIEQVRMRRERGRSIAGRTYLSIVLSVIIVFLAMFSQLVAFPDTAHGLTRPPTFVTASSTPYATTDGWAKALTWMKNNTPEPFGPGDAFYRHFQQPADGQSFAYPPSMYGVLCWWDYGYWVTYIAHRVPNANPGQASTPVTKVANFLTAQDEASADAVAEDLNSAYVVMDDQTATSKFYAVSQWAGQAASQFQDVYYVPQQSSSQLSPVELYYPQYYQSMAIRLYNFDGKAVTTDNVTVISYQENVDKTTGQSFKQITDARQFTSSQAAQDFISSQKTGNYRVVGIDPMTSPVSLDALQHYKLIYSSPNQVSLSSSNGTAEVKIFQRVK